MIVTLLTDFGTVDHYVGVMKGVLLSAEPRIAVVDLGHDLRPGDIGAAAYSLLAAYDAFPPRTVHVAVVDPGVGTPRRVLVVRAAGQLFVGPDNGLFSYLLEREPGARVYHVTEERLVRTPRSTTFHGRDVFAPLGAALACGTDPAELGPVVEDLVRLPSLAPVRAGEGAMTGRVLHVDRFGNCITSMTRGDLSPLGDAIVITAGGEEIRSMREHYAGGPGGMPFGIWGSSGFLELSVNGGSAAELLGIRAGDAVLARGAGEPATPGGPGYPGGHP